MCTGGGFNNVLVIGADSLSRYVDWTDRGTCILFGDAAGAVLVQVIGLFFSFVAIYEKQIPCTSQLANTNIIKIPMHAWILAFVL